MMNRFPSAVFAILTLVAGVLHAESAQSGCTVLFSGAENFSRFETNEPLWRTDGTKAGTAEIATIWKDPDLDFASPIAHLTASPDMKYALFSAITPSVGRELFFSDGTKTGTRLLKDLYRGGLDYSGSPEPYGIDPVLNRFTTYFHVGRRTLFIADGPNFEPSVWSSDGTPAGTTKLLQLKIGDGDSAILLASDGTTALFMIEHPFPMGNEVWQTDGTTLGTRQIAVVPPNNARGAAAFAPGKFVFTFDAESLWLTDGTASGTKSVRTFHQIYDLQGYPDRGYALLVADDGKTGLELWRTDGTKTGTYLLRNIMPYDTDSTPRNFFAFGGYIYFVADTDGKGSELWRTDGTITGTKFVKDVNPGLSKSSPRFFVVFGGLLYFVADYSDGKSHLFRLDATQTKVDLVKGLDTISGDLIALNKYMIIGGDEGIYSYDGTKFTFLADLLYDVMQPPYVMTKVCNQNIP